MTSEIEAGIKSRCKSAEEAYIEPIGRFFCDALLKDIRYLLDVVSMQDYTLSLLQLELTKAEDLQGRLAACELAMDSLHAKRRK